MFIVKKIINGKEYYYLRKSARIDGKVKAVNVAYLGKCDSREDALKKAKEFRGVKKTGEGKDFKPKEIKSSMTEKKSIVEESNLNLEELASFCKRKGFVYPSSEIYGGLAGIWDFGPVGVELKNNIKQEWWKFHVHRREDMTGIDGSIITPRKMWEASGHLSSFFDVAVKCKKCKYTTKIDAFEVEKSKCEKCNEDYEVLGKFNQLFPLQLGALNPSEGYLRGETAQVIFADFKLVADNARMSLPFGIAQIGKAFRNEISPREFIFRDRELEQMEIEYFIGPNQACPYSIGDTQILVFSESMQKNNQDPIFMKITDALNNGIIKRDWHAYWMEQEILWFKSLGVNLNNFRLRQHLSDERSHYSSDTWDLEFKFPMGWREFQGFADRSNYDLTQHQKFSSKNLSITDPKFGKVLPEVVCEPSLGVERAFMIFLLEAYSYDEKRQNVVLKLHPKLAPVKAAVFPIVKKDEAVVSIARKVFDLLRDTDIVCSYDSSGTVGRRYARNDEIGTPFCITVDSESIQNSDVTIRDRDSQKQIRVPIKNLPQVLKNLINGSVVFSSAGKLQNIPR